MENPWKPIEAAPLNMDVNTTAVAKAIKQAKARKLEEEARGFIPAKKYSTPLEGYVFKLSEVWLGFHNERGTAKVNLGSALFPVMPDTARLQLRLDDLTQKLPAAKDEPSEESPSTCKSKMKKKKKGATRGSQSVADGSLMQQQEQ